MLNESYKKEMLEVFESMKAEKEQEINKDRLECGKITAEHDYYNELFLKYPEYKEQSDAKNKEYQDFINKYINDTEKKHRRLDREIMVIEDLIKKNTHK